MEAKVDTKELGRSRGRVLDGKTLKELYLEREALEAKKKKRPQKCSKQPSKPPQSDPPPTRKQSGKRKAVSFITICSSGREDIISGEELDGWDSDLETLSINSSSSILSTITLATPATARSQRPQTPPSPTPGPSSASCIASEVRVTRSHASGR